jgi:hypothetical protein
MVRAPSDGSRSKSILRTDLWILEIGYSGICSAGSVKAGREKRPRLARAFLSRLFRYLLLLVVGGLDFVLVDFLGQLILLLVDLGTLGRG